MKNRVTKILTNLAVAGLVSVAASGVTAQVLLFPRVKAELEKDLRTIYNPETVRMSLGSKAFLADLALGKFSHLTVEMEGIDSAQAATAADRFITPVKFSIVSFDLSEVHFDRRHVLGGVSAFEAGSGRMKARLEEAELNRFLEAEGYGITVTLAPGEVSTTADVAGDGGRRLKISAKAELEISDTSLVLVPRSIDQKGVEAKSARTALQASLPIPPIAGIRGSTLEVFEHYLVFEAPVLRLFGESPPDDRGGEAIEGGAGRAEPLPAASPTPTTTPTNKRTPATPSPTKTTPAATTAPSPTKRR